MSLIAVGFGNQNKNQDDNNNLENKNSVIKELEKRGQKMIENY